MFIISPASSSRLPQARLLSTSSVAHVKRPQKPFEGPIARIDAYGNRIPVDNEGMGREERRRMEFLESLTERKARSVIEKYGSREGFGLRHRSQPSGPNATEERAHNHESYRSGGAFGAVDGQPKFAIKNTDSWKRQIGLTGRGKKVFIPAEERFREQARALGEGGGDTEIYQQPRWRESKRVQDSSAQKSPRTNFGLSAPSASASASASLSTSDASSSFTSKDTDGPSSVRDENRSFDQRRAHGSRGARYEGASGRGSSSFGAKKSFGLSSRSREAGQGSDYHNHDGFPSFPSPSSISTSNSPQAPSSHLSHPSSPPSGIRNQRYPFSQHTNSPINTGPDDLGRAAMAGGSMQGVGEAFGEVKEAELRGPWQPKKKLTYSAMAGLKTLYELDPEKFSREVLSKKFGISREAVSRILKSRFRDQPSVSPAVGTGGELGSGAGGEPNSIRGTKWDRNPGTAETVSPVPAIMRAYARANATDHANGDVNGGRSGSGTGRGGSR